MTRDRESLPLTLGEDGWVRDARGKALSVGEVAVVLEHPEVEEEWRKAHRRYQWTYQPMIWGGTALLHGGIFVTFIGSLMNAESFDGGDPLIPSIGVGSALVGGGLVTGGIIGWTHARRTVDTPGWWFDEREIEHSLGRLPPIQVELTLGPGSVGINGTF